VSFRGNQKALKQRHIHITHVSTQRKKNQKINLGISDEEIMLNYYLKHPMGEHLFKYILQFKYN